MKLILTLILISTFMPNIAQSQELPYKSIIEYPEVYTAGTVAARMIDGLGFRYYWATESLRKEDLEYKVSEEGRTSLETIEHIYGLSNMILNSLTVERNSSMEDDLSVEELRKRTLFNFKKASDILMGSEDKDLENYKIRMGSKKQPVEFPFWNNINGPIADALWHCGQIVMLRRTSGNPINPNVSVFLGTVRE